MPRYQYSGRIDPDDELHQPVDASASNLASHQLHVPQWVTVNIHDPDTKVIKVPQYEKTVHGRSGYNPAYDCEGYFTTSKFQQNNNCYAYGCDIATNSFPQPGRKSGHNLPGRLQDGPTVERFAESDGLVKVGKTVQELINFRTKNIISNPTLGGHFVALLISPDELDKQGNVDWKGDYHWVRCDNSIGSVDSWSHKLGKDAMTNFDFAGRSIVNPMEANWTWNKGPGDVEGSNDMVGKYEFYTFMFVPWGKVDII